MPGPDAAHPPVSSECRYHWASFHLNLKLLGVLISSSWSYLGRGAIIQSTICMKLILPSHCICSDLELKWAAGVQQSDTLSLAQDVGLQDHAWAGPPLNTHASFAMHASLTREPYDKLESINCQTFHTMYPDLSYCDVLNLSKVKLSNSNESTCMHFVSSAHTTLRLYLLPPAMDNRYIIRGRSPAPCTIW